MDHYQHTLTSNIKWDVGDVLVIDVSGEETRINPLPSAPSVSN